MNKPARLLAKLVRLAAPCAAMAMLALWTLNAPGAAPEDRNALARKSFRGDAATAPIPKPLAAKPLVRESDTITPNTPIWNLPVARPGHDAPKKGTPRLAAMHGRATTVARERPAMAYAELIYPELQPTTALAWSPKPNSNELSVPGKMSGPDRAMSGDPTAVQSHEAILVGRPILRQAPVEFLRLNIPQPFALVDPIRMSAEAMPADNDPPAMPQTPADPTMPVSPRR